MTLTERVHELVVALLSVYSSVGYGGAAGGGLAKRSRGVVLTVAAAAVVAAPRGTGRIGRAAAAAAAHLLDHLHLGSQLCPQRQEVSEVSVRLANMSHLHSKLQLIQLLKRRCQISYLFFKD